MNRNEEYRALLAELEQTPPELDSTVERASRRSAQRKRRRLFSLPLGSLAACFAAFVVLVNVSVPFAHACGSIPLLRELAKAVAWSPSLSAAVENEYVQPIGQSRTENGITATIEYLIVDQKQVNIFFTLEGEGYKTLSTDFPEFTPEQACSKIGAMSGQAPGTLLSFSLDYPGEVPDGFTMTFGVTGERAGEEEPSPEYPGADQSIADEMLAPRPAEEREILAEFTFDLQFDPQFTDQGEIIPVNETFQMDGQTFTVTEAEIYPTHVRINVEGDPANTAWLKGLDFYLENEDGERFDTVTNGVSASGDEDTPAMVSFRLESPYFSDSEHLTLSITGAEWLEKEHERVYIDLMHETAPWLPEGVTLTSAQLREGGWFLMFQVAPTNGPASSPFSIYFYDAEGNRWETDQIGFSTSGDKEPGHVMLPLKDYREDEVWLEAYYSHDTTEDTPIVIPTR